jgi:nucleoside-triphosphatase
MRRHLLLTGRAGCGKTTVILRVAAGLRESGRPARGFWTQEARRGGARIGFRIDTVSGERGMLATVGHKSPFRVGRYGVDLNTFESVGLPELEAALSDAASGAPVPLLVDEIGRMELLSQLFRRAVERCFSEVPHVVATIMQRQHPFCDALKAREDVRVITVTPANRDLLPREVLRALT